MSANSRPHLRRLTAAWLRLYRLLAWLTQPKFTIGAMVVVSRPSGEMLLVRQRLRTPSLWGFPGGFQKLGETAAEAARRELREEVGLDLVVRESDQVAQYQQPWAHHLDVVFTVTYDDRTAPVRRTSLEILEVGWFWRDELPALTREAALALKHLPGQASASDATSAF